MDAQTKPDRFLCLNNPWHVYPQTDPTRCRWCGQTRTAAEALTSIVAGSAEGWSRELASALVEQHAAEVRANG
jgi:hypothetical protein